MNLLFLSINYYPEFTGTGKYTHELAHALTTDHDIDIEVISAAPHYPYWKVFDGYTNLGWSKSLEQGVTVYRSPCYIPATPSGLKRSLMEFTFILFAFPLSLYLACVKKYDAVVVISPSIFTFFLSLPHKLFRRSKIITHIQDLQVDMAVKTGQIRNPLSVKLLYRLERLILNSSDYLSTITNGMKEKLLAKLSHHRPIQIIPNWASELSNSNKSIEHIIPNALYADKFVCLYTGAMGQKQGLEILIETAKKLQTTDTVFIIVGDGSAKAELIHACEQQKLKNIHFFAPVEFDYLPEVLSIASLCLVIQKEDVADYVMPSKVTNYLQAYKPVLATCKPNTELYDLIHTEGVGVTVDPGCADQMAERILQLTADESTLQAMGKKSGHYAAEKLNKDVIVRKFEKAFLS